MPQVYKMAHTTESRVEHRPILEIEGDRPVVRFLASFKAF